LTEGDRVPFGKISFGMFSGYEEFAIKHRPTFTKQRPDAMRLP
jgi:hypothetical protein